MSTEPQAYATHRRFVPLYHFVVLPWLLVNAIYSVYYVFATAFEPAAIFYAVTAVLLVPAVLYARLFPLRCQDRIIRLEMQLRLARLLPDDLARRIGELTPAQLIALRFAGDAELEGLVRRVLDERIVHGETIKRLVTDWQPDTLRV